ncbi:MAG: DUF2306 domain-containing protein [Bacteroidia bacterium]|nr:DUF2306 domain-containing protein [Bacteroidia bacterium]NND51662.1 DUF2306 domain-containing protein [Flavobacteriaceae bacterium]
MLENIIHSSTGWFHTVSAVLALIFGTTVVLKTKGTTLHKRIGYAYVTCMILLNASSFFLNNFGGFSLFHFFAIVSLLTVLAGIIPAILRVKNWFPLHYYFMSWSVVGLYAALWAEIGTRFVKSENQFWWAVALATFITVGIGNTIIKRKAKQLKLK